VRLFDRLFQVEQPDHVPEDGHFRDNLNPDSCRELVAKGEMILMQAEPGERYQFERTGYFIADAKDSQPGQPVFNRIVPLKDSWTKKHRS